jgi:hypothetical protein
MAATLGAMLTRIVAALFGLFVVTTSASAGPLTTGERQRLIAHFEMTEAWLVSELERLSDAQLKFKMTPETTEDDLRGRPLAGGNQDLYQWFLMISTHSQRHIMQIREIKAHPAYPKA